MKVGTITFHFASNQGAVLQCFALQKYLKREGHEVKVINYRPKYHTVRYDKFKNPFRYSLWYWKKFSSRKLPRRIFLTIKSFIRCIVLNTNSSERRNADAFTNFINKNIPLTKEYTSFKQLKKNPPDFDAYVVGSDQLWNTDLLDFEFEPAYFLSFGKPEVKRIAYAVSIGKKLSKYEKAEMKNFSKDLDIVSLREYDKEAIDAIGRDVHICVDPTFLIDEEDYDEIVAPRVYDKKYIFVYGFENTSETHEAIKLAKEKYGCEVINGSPHRIHIEGAINKRDYAPDTFLSLIKNAECVITNSFHATVFSIIYKNDFITVPHTTRNIRMQELLDKTGLSYRMYGNDNFDFNKEIDYVPAYEKLKELSLDSKEYLRLSLSGEFDKIKNNCPKEKATPSRKEVAYYGYSLDKKIQKSSASGGAAYELSRQFIQDGGVVFGVKSSPDCKRAYYTKVESLDKLFEIQGSKYIYPELSDENNESIFSLVAKELKDNKKVLFIGTGCIVGALLRNLDKDGIDTSNLYTSDLICHGPTYQKYLDLFIDNLEKKYGSKAVSINTRAYKKSWNHPVLKIRFENGKEYAAPLYGTDFGFAMKYLCFNGCYKCNFKGDSHIADITLGDYWGITPSRKEFNPDGVSLLLTRTKKGEELVSGLDKESFFIEKTDLEFALDHNKMYSESAKKPADYDLIVENIEKHGFKYAIDHSKEKKIFKKAALKNKLNSLKP